MANSLCGDIERHTDCTSYRLFDSSNYTMVVRDGHRRALWFRLRSRDISRQGRSEIRRRALCDPERNYHRRIDRHFYRHVGHQNDLIHVEELHLRGLMKVPHFMQIGPLTGMLSTIVPAAKILALGV
jgi:hypothetical protein